MKTIMHASNRTYRRYRKSVPYRTSLTGNTVIKLIMSTPLPSSALLKDDLGIFVIGCA